MSKREEKVKPSSLFSALLKQPATSTAIRFDAPFRKIGFLIPLAVLLFATQARAAAFDCLIEPTQTAELASPVTGMLDQVHVKRGDRVAKGQVLATLESRAERAAADLARFKSEQKGPIQAAESKYEFAKRKFERRQSMSSERLIAVQERDDAEAEYRFAEAELMVAKENQQIAGLEYQQQSGLLALRTIKSPVDGVVVDQGAFPGEVVEPGSNQKAVLKVAQLDPLRVHMILPKDLFGKVSVGMAVDVSPEIPAQKSYVAKVKTVDRLVDAASGTFVVFLEMANSKLSIPAGVKCKAIFRGLQAGSAK
jgi:RND family efflux transporter MFP subunit